MATSKIYFNPRAYGLGILTKDGQVVADMNNVLYTGFYATDGNTLNMPTGLVSPVCAFIQVARGESYRFQLLVDYLSGKLYKRTSGTGGAWGNWVEV